MKQFVDLYVCSCGIVVYTEARAVIALVAIAYVLRQFCASIDYVRALAQASPTFSFVTDEEKKSHYLLVVLMQ